jgi:hypothetical protein
MAVTRPSWRGPVVSALTALLCFSGCGPLPKGEYWKGSYAHLDHPRYRFDVPEGWREVKPADFGLLAFNRRAFASLDDAARNVLFKQAELQLQALDTGLISERGAWIQIASEAGSGGWYGTGTGNLFERGPLRFGLTDSQKQAFWERFAANRVQKAPPSDKPKLTLEVIDVASYGLNRALRMRFRSDEARGSLHWTVLGMYTTNDTVSLAHLGTPENRDEGIDGFEAIAASLRFD